MRMGTYGGSGIRRTSERIAALADRIEATKIESFPLYERDHAGTDLPFIVSDNGFESVRFSSKP